MATTFTIINGAAQDELQDAQKVLERLRNFQRPYDSRRDALYSQLIGYTPPAYFPDKRTPRSNVSVPYPFANFDQVRATIMEALFLTDPPFEVLPRGMKDSGGALAMQRVMELLALQKGRLRATMDEYVGGLAVYGFYPLYVGWDWDYDTVPSWEVQPAFNPDGSYQVDYATGMPLLARTLVRKKVPRNRPCYQTIDIYDLLIDPDGAHIARLFYKTLPQMIREQEMATLAGQHLYDPAALYELQRYLQDKPDAETAIINIAELWDTVNQKCTLVTTAADPEVLSYKDKRFANRAAMYSTWRRTTCDREPLLLAPKYDNPYMHCKVPILYTSYTKLPGEPFGFGVIEPVAGMVEHLNKSVRAIEDNWNMGVNQRYAIDLERNIDLEGLQRANVPGGIVGLYGNVNEVMKELPTHTPQAGDYAIIPLFQQMIETGSGQSDFYSRGVGTPKGNETATGISSVIAQASKRLTGVVQRLEEDILEPLLQMTASNIQQFITDDIEVRITDEMPAIGKINSAFVTITPEDLAGSFDFRLMGALYMENRTVQQAHMMQLGEMIATNPMFAAYIKPYEWLQETQRVFRIPYPGRFIKTPEEVAMEQAMMIQQQLMVGALQQKMGLAPDERQIAAAKGGGGKPPGGKGDSGRNYAKPASNPATTTTRSSGQQTGLNALGMEGMGLAQ